MGFESSGLNGDLSQTSDLNILYVSLTSLELGINRTRSSGFGKTNYKPTKEPTKNIKPLVEKVTDHSLFPASP